MIVAIDNREQLAYSFQGYDCIVEAATLNVGDYSITGFTDKIAVERKSWMTFLAASLQAARDSKRNFLAHGPWTVSV